MASSPDLLELFADEIIPDQWVRTRSAFSPVNFNYNDDDDNAAELEDELLREYLEQADNDDDDATSSGDDNVSVDLDNESDNDIETASEASGDSLFVAQDPPAPPLALDFLARFEQQHERVRHLTNELRVQEERNALRLRRLGQVYHRFDPEEFDDADLDDELILMEIEPRRPRRATPAARAAPAADAEVIDLTNVPDSPDRPARGSLLQPRAPPPAPSVLHRNPRRQGPIQRTPSLTRSDGSLLGNNRGEVIDLTLDDDAPPAAAPIQPPPRRQPARALQTGNVRETIMQALNNSRAFRAFPGMPDIFQQLFHGHPAELELVMGGPGMNPLGANAPNLNYGGANRPSPKPAYVPPPKPRDGFTRSAVTSDEDAVVCPGCEEELKYDPEDSSPLSPPAPKKARQSRKDQEEHHFWAVKECGHVYCKNCYENRSKGKGLAKPTFRTGLESARRKTLCNVPDCDSDVTNKTSWVGLFL